MTHSEFTSSQFRKFIDDPSNLDTEFTGATKSRVTKRFQAVVDGCKYTVLDWQDLREFRFPRRLIEMVIRERAGHAGEYDVLYRKLIGHDVPSWNIVPLHDENGPIEKASKEDHRDVREVLRQYAKWKNVLKIGKKLFV